MYTVYTEREEGGWKGRENTERGEGGWKGRKKGMKNEDMN